MWDTVRQVVVNLAILMIPPAKKTISKRSHEEPLPQLRSSLSIQIYPDARSEQVLSTDFGDSMGKQQK